MSLIDLFYDQLIDAAADAYSDGADCYVSDPLDPAANELHDEATMLVDRAHSMADVANL